MNPSETLEKLEVIIMQNMWSQMDALRKLHEQRTGHTVWVHRRKYDIALACWDCTGRTAKPKLQCQWCLEKGESELFEGMGELLEHTRHLHSGQAIWYKSAAVVLGAEK